MTNYGLASARITMTRPFRDPLGSSAFAAIEVITYPLERLESEDHCLKPLFVSIVKGRSICSKSAAGFLVAVEPGVSTGGPDLDNVKCHFLAAAAAPPIGRYLSRKPARRAIHSTGPPHLGMLGLGGALSVSRRSNSSVWGSRRVNAGLISVGSVPGRLWRRPIRAAARMPPSRPRPPGARTGATGATLFNSETGPTWPSLLSA